MKKQYIYEYHRRESHPTEFIDLKVVSGKEAVKEWTNSDREDIINLNYLQLKNIDLDDIWKPTEQIVFLRGVGGIGKSTLINRYVLRWAEDKILKEETEDGKIDFLFFFECRQLNTTPVLNTLKNLLEENYRNIFKSINICDLQDIADRVLIIVDGLDELQGIYDEEQEKLVPITELIKTVINGKSPFLKNHKTIACGRHNACEVIKSRLLKSPKVKTIEISGFSETNTFKYIEQFFQEDTMKADKVKGIIKEKKNIRFIASVPVFLKIICQLYSGDFAEEIRSTTELYTYAMLIFLKDHLQINENLDSKSIRRLADHKKLGKIVYSLAELSKETYMNHKVVFEKEDIGNFPCLLHLEQTGFIVKQSVGIHGAEVYQFRHLTMQEFLCSLYLYLTKDVTIMNLRELSSCIPIILGMYHIVKGRSNKSLVAFYQNLLELMRNKSLNDPTNSPESNADREEEYFLFIKEKMIDNLLCDNTAFYRNHNGGRSIFLRPSSFAIIEMILIENNWLVDEELLNEVKKYGVVILIRNKYEGMIALEFLNSLKIGRIDKLDMVMSSVEEFGDEHRKLFEMIKHEERKEHKELGITLQHMTEEFSYSLYTISRNDSTVYSHISDKSTLPDVLKKHCDTFTIEAVYGDVADYAFPFVADLIEHVLEHGGKKKLKFQKFENKDKYAILLKRIQETFSQKKHFENILFQDD